MKKRLMGAIALMLLLSVTLFGCGSKETGLQVSDEGHQNEEPQQTDDADEEAVSQLVKDFGRNLQNVSLLAPEDVVKKSLEENYGDFISEALLSKWINDPESAPGRMVSSPWPDRIEILSVEKSSESEYEVKGEIIEVTSEEQTHGGIAAKRLITLLVKNMNNRWLIDDVTLGAYEEKEDDKKTKEEADSIVYENTQYGFDFTLPESWKDYKIVMEEWEGFAIEDSEGEKVVETGPMLLIRHPVWTSEHPHQDIPIMVFTFEQWDSLQNEKFHIGAAPIGPKELGRNNKYVFALPARYNFAFPTGYEEVENILEGNPLQPTEVR
jgi:hypothetical protein